MNPVFRAYLLAVTLLAAGMAGAQPALTLNPYEARVPVADQSLPARDRALQEALTQVVNRVGGDGAAITAAALIARAPQLVQRYGYDVDPLTRQLELVASFDARSIESQLRASGVAVWGVNAAPVEEVRLSIDGLRSAQDYAGVIARLRSLPGVRNLQVVSASGGQLDLRLRAEGGAQRLSGALYASGGLIPDTPAAGTELGYRLP